jgi:hypothetical protein
MWSARQTNSESVTLTQLIVMRRPKTLGGLPHTSQFHYFSRSIWQRRSLNSLLQHGAPVLYTRAPRPWSITYNTIYTHEQPNCIFKSPQPANGMSPSRVICDWIDTIPNSKLEGGICDRGTIYDDRNFRLDNQGTITRGPAMYNLQVQVNKNCKLTTFKKQAPKSFAWILAPADDPWSAAEIKAALKASVTGLPLRRPGNQ